MSEARPALETEIALRCPVCDRLLPDGLARRRFCSPPCASRGGERERRGRPVHDKPGQAAAWEEKRRRTEEGRRTAFFDLAGLRFGRLVVLGRAPHDRPTETMWFVRCDCGREERARSYLLRSGAKWRCRPCKLRAEAGAARKAPSAQRGRCSWDGKRATKRNRFECSACNRRAVRNGRDETGRPLGVVLAQSAACVVCGQPNGPGRLRTCSAECAAANERRVARERDRRRRHERERG